MSSQSLPDGVPDDCHQLIRHAVEYWRSVHPADGLPGRQHIDPVDIPALLPYIRLVDVIGKPPQFRIRLMGSAAVDFFEQDFTGCWFHEICAQFPGSESEAILLTVVRSKKPSWRSGPGRLFGKKNYENIERVILPLAANGRDIDMLLIVHVFQKKQVEH